MAYYGGTNPPAAPDIRQQRPGYFYRNQGEDFGNEFAMPEGMTPYDPQASDWNTQVPDLWPEIQEQLRGIMQQPRQPFFMGTAKEPLTPEQIEHNKMLMAWKTPSGLQAIETGKYRESQESARNIDRAETRVANYGKQLLQAFKAEAPKGMIQQLEKSYNQAANQLDKLLGEGQESGYPRYSGKGKMQLEGIEKEPGFFSRLLSGFKDKADGAPVEQPTPEGVFQPPEEIMEGPADVAPEHSTLMLRGLLEADRLMHKYLGKDAEAAISQINATTTDPGERADAVLEKLPDNPETKKLRARMAIWKMTPARKSQQADLPPGQVQTGRHRQYQPRVKKFKGIEYGG